MQKEQRKVFKVYKSSYVINNSHNIIIVLHVQHFVCCMSLPDAAVAHLVVYDYGDDMVQPRVPLLALPLVTRSFTVSLSPTLRTNCTTPDGMPAAGESPCRATPGS